MPVTGPYIDTPSPTTTIDASVTTSGVASFNRPPHLRTPQLVGAEDSTQRRVHTAWGPVPGGHPSLTILTNRPDGRNAHVFGRHFGEYLLAST